MCAMQNQLGVVYYDEVRIVITEYDLAGYSMNRRCSSFHFQSVRYWGRRRLSVSTVSRLSVSENVWRRIDASPGRVFEYPR